MSLCIWFEILVLFCLVAKAAGWVVSKYCIIIIIIISIIIFINNWFQKWKQAGDTRNTLQVSLPDIRCQGVCEDLMRLMINFSKSSYRPIKILPSCNKTFMGAKLNMMVKYWKIDMSSFRLKRDDLASMNSWPTQLSFCWPQCPDTREGLQSVLNQGLS